MTTKQIYLQFETLKNEKENYSPDEYQDKLNHLLKLLSNSCKPEFECEPGEISSLNRLLSFS